MSDLQQRSHELVGDWATDRTLWIVRNADRQIALREVAMCRDGIADLRKVRSLTKWILAAADAVQLRICGDVNHTAKSHRTCVIAVEGALHAHPPPFDTDQDTKDQWLEQLTDRAAQMLDIAADLEDQHRAAVRRGDTR